MTELICDYQTSGSGLIYLSHPFKDFPNLSDDDWDLLQAQGFVWYSDYVGFGSRGQLYSYWAKVYLADNCSIKASTSRAILLPFTVPSDGNLLLGASIDLPICFQIPPGSYKLLFETRYVTDNEIRSSERYNSLLEYLDNPESNVGLGDEDRPEMCFFTFAPAAKVVKPQIIYPSYEKLMSWRWRGEERDGAFDPRRQLILYNKPSLANE